MVLGPEVRRVIVQNVAVLGRRSRCRAEPAALLLAPVHAGGPITPGSLQGDSGS